MSHPFLSSRWLHQIVPLLALVLCLSACERILALKLDRAPTVTKETFNNAIGLELPYEVYLPSAMVGWKLTSATQMQFDAIKKMYVIDHIPIDIPMRDLSVPRFKISGDAWRNQFGFGSDLTDDESTFGIPNGEVVLQLERFPQAVSDLRFELPPIAPSTSKSVRPAARVMRVEFKVTSIEPVQMGLIHVVLHSDSDLAH